MISVGLVGLGWAAREIWIPRLAAHPGLELHSGVDPDPEAAAAARRASPELRVHGDLDALLDAGPDLVLVATPNRIHVPSAVRALERGVHAFVEKPVCLERGEVEALRAAAGRAGAVLVPSCASRLRSDVAALSEVVGSGELGTVRSLELEWVRARGIPRLGGWFTHGALAGGGSSVDLGWHLLDVGLSLIGFPAVRDALAAGFSDNLVAEVAEVAQVGADWRGDGSGSASLEPDVEDSALALLRLETGAAVLLRTAWASQRSHDRTRIAVHGANASAVLTTTFGFSPLRVESPSLTVHRRGEVRTVEGFEEPIGAEYDRQLDRLEQAVRRGPDPAVFDEVERTADAIERVCRSIAAG